MKFNWGTGIALFYSLFMCTMIYMVYRSTQTDRNMVVENYYEKDLQYQSHLDKLNNSLQLNEDLKIIQNQENKTIKFSFPKGITDVEGDILFYRTSDNSKDITSKILIDKNHEFIFPTKQLQKGGWKIKVDWQGDKVPFFKEVNIRI